MRPLTVLAILAVVLPAGCGYDSTAPAPPVIEGAYHATIFTTAVHGIVTDRLAEGGSITITLNGDGTTTGSLFASGAGVSMAGTWDTDGSVVHFHQDVNTFVRQTPFEVSPDALRGVFDDGARTIRVTLVK